MNHQKHYKLIACEILFREFSECVTNCKNIIDVVYMPKGLHDMGESKMATILQEEISKVDATKYDAILLGYALCNNGIRGLHASIAMVVPRAHDCITLLMGSKEKYQNYFVANPGTYFKSPGWIERGEGCLQNDQSIPAQMGISSSYQDYVELYGEENAKYFMETIGNWYKHYKKVTYIDTKVGNVNLYKEQTKKDAEKNNWEYEEISGDTTLLKQLINGDWNEKDFLVVPAGKQIQSAFNNDEIIKIE